MENASSQIPMHADTLPVAPAPSADLTRRRRAVEARLREIGRPRLARRSPPPDGRLGADEQPMRRLRETLIEFGPVFASFGRYLATRLDLLPRRDCLELAAIPDAGEALDEREVATVIQRDLGAVPDRRFFAFDATPTHIARWTEEHEAWLSPGVPVTVRIVRPDAGAVMAADLPLLPLLAPWLGLSEAALAPAVHDFALSLRRRLDQEHQAASLARLAADVPVGGLFHAPGAYSSHCSPGILTLERVEGTPASESTGHDGRDPEAPGGLLARRIAAAWLRQATIGQVVPYDFSLDDIVIAGDRLVLRSASFEPHSAVARARFLNYVNAVAADDPDTAAVWLLAETAAPGVVLEEEVRRRLRQAVPFRDGEWSGDDRLAEQLLVQWRVTRQTGLELPAHQLHVYLSIQTVSSIATALAPDSDALLAALQEERLRAGIGTAQPLMDPRAIPATLDKLMQGMVNLPQKLDEVLTLAADGRLRVKLHLPPDEESRKTRNRTVSLISGLVVLTALAFALRHVSVAQVPGLEQAGALLVMAVGLWLLIAAARL